MPHRLQVDLINMRPGALTGEWLKVAALSDSSSGIWGPSTSTEASRFELIITVPPGQDSLQATNCAKDGFSPGSELVAASSCEILITRRH